MFVDPMGLEKAILTIYSDRWSSWNESFIEGHSWIEITKNWHTITYWLWPDRDSLKYPVSDWIQVNWPETYLNYDNFEYAKLELDKNKMEILNDYIYYSIYNIKWGYAYPCSAWASDAWNTVSEYKLEDRNSFWISNPNTLADSINNL